MKKLRKFTNVKASQKIILFAYLKFLLFHIKVSALMIGYDFMNNYDNYFSGV